MTTAAITEDEVGILLAAAVLAPSLHNTQPWRFEVHGPVVDVLLDRARTRSLTDPADRFTRIGLGAAAFSIRVAAAMTGQQTTVAIDPDPADPRVAVRLFLAPPHAPLEELAALYPQLRRRHTYRGPMRPDPVPAEVEAALSHAARTEGATLHWIDQPVHPLLKHLLQTADTRSPVNGPTQQPAPGRLAVLSTPEEDSAAWIQTGFALQALLLTATSHDVAGSFVNRVVEYSDLRGRLRRFLGDEDWPQLVLNLGYPAHQPSRTTRRSWQSALDHRF